MNISRNSHEQAQQELQTFYQQNLGIVYRYVYSKVGIREEAEDLTAQIFVKAVRDMDVGRDQRSVQKWLFQVAHTTIADYWRHYFRVPISSLEELLDEGWQGPTQEDSVSVSMAPIEKVERIMHLLPQQYRDVLNCRFLLSLSIKETAQKLSLSEANVKVVQFRALKRAAELEPMINDEG